MQLLRSGVTATMHNHTLLNPAEPEAEFNATIAAYGRTGIRVAFAPQLITNDNVFVYGDNDAFVASLPEPVRRLAQGIRQRSTALSLERYLAAVAHLCQRHAADPRVHIMHGPLAPQWVDDEALTALKADARENNIPIHIHVQQTRLQKLHGLKTYGKTLLAHMDDIGFLGPEVTCGHCVWITAEDIDLLAERGCGVTNHVSCNLRVRNGICPAHALLRRGVPVAIGIDDKGLADSRDFIEEMRLVSKLNRNPSHRLDSDHLTTADVFTMGTVNGARALGWEGRCGRIAKGLQADLTLVDLGRIRAPFTWSGHRMTDLLLYRGRASDVDTVMVGGEILLENGRFTRLDPEEVLARLRESMPADYDRRWAENNRLAPELRRHITDWFAPWYEELEAETPDPFFYLNGRR
jgi:cytosine/adenosine deaminase-related metal-dependent hydrolase